ncbi:FG-GAP repeat domain-containing protein [Sporobolomyces salmoneus]|uniref:FG-GAP repeat domain-containing protein n=1 Tax=Sporobolomyces salmoneus TaxID=183962 RepID=UPI00317F6D38
MLSSLLFLVVISLSSSSTRAWSFPSLSSLFPSHTHRFTSEKLLDLGSLGLPKTGKIAAWGDFDSDQFLDLFHLSYDQRSLSVWTWDRKEYVWKEQEETLIKTKGDFIVTNVVPGDFNRDGKLDLLLMGEQQPGSGWSKETQLLVYLQTLNGTFAEPYTLDSSSLPQPIPLDATGTMQTSLFGFSPTSASSPQLWLNTASSSPNDSSLFTSTDASARFDYSSHPTGEWNCNFPNPHSNQFLDLDGDCLADVFVTCMGGKNGDDKDHLRYEVWINEKKGSLRGGEGDEEGQQTEATGGKFVWKRGGDLPKGTKSVSFADMDRDGTLDMILTVCPSSNNRDCSIQIAYNDQIPLCTSTSGPEEDCRDIENLCVADPNFGFNLNDSEDNASLSKFVVSKDLIASHNLVTSSTSFRGFLPTPPQIGDYNIDGYPDLLLLVSPQAHSSQRRVKLLQSRPCSPGKCTEAQIRTSRRRYEVVEGDAKGVEEMEKFTDVESVSWVDLDDDGSLDIVLQRSGQSGAARQINFIKNNFFNDAFFLKAMVLNGACKSWCEPTEPGQTRYRPYGSSYSGASFKFTVLDPTGARRSTQYAQLPSTSYMSLGLPYAHLGLGRTNNYVENLFIGSTRSQQEQHFINLEGVIPNSQVLILPYQSSETEGKGDVGEWRKELYLKPGDWIPWVTVVLLTAIVGLGIVVLVLHLNEKREDEVERRARLLSLNFGAL